MSLVFRIVPYFFLPLGGDPPDVDADGSLRHRRRLVRNLRLHHLQRLPLPTGQKKLILLGATYYTAL